MGYPLRKLDLPRLSGHTFISAHIPPQRERIKLVSQARKQTEDEIACDRVRRWLFEMGKADKGAEDGSLDYGWMAHVSERSGLTYGVTRAIIHRDQTRLSLYSARMISRKTGIPLHIFYDVTSP